MTLTPTATLTPGSEEFHVSKNVFRAPGDSVAIRVAIRNYPGDYRLVVYNSAGECVKLLGSGQLTAAFEDTFIWNGTNQNGENCASGLYFFSLVEPFNRRTARILLIH
jgi:flagellar hook assembly protein FlgD